MGKGHKGGCKLVTFKGDAHEIVEWKAKPMAYQRTKMHAKSGAFIRSAQVQKEDVTAGAVELEYGEQVSEVMEFSAILKSEIIGCCVKEPCGTVSGVEDGNGLEGMSSSGIATSEARTAMTKRAHLKAIAINTPANNVEDLEGNLRRLEFHMKQVRFISRSASRRGLDTYRTDRVMCKSA